MRFSSLRAIIFLSLVTFQFTMAAPRHKLSASYQALHLEHLVLQSEHLLFVRDRHLHWRAETDDPEISAMHQSLADLLEQVACQYEDLIRALQKE